MLTPRQAEVAGLVARGLSTKAIAQETGLAVPTVKEYIKQAAGRIPGDTPPRHKLILWFFQVGDDHAA